MICNNAATLRTIINVLIHFQFTLYISILTLNFRDKHDRHLKIDTHMSM